MNNVTKQKENKERILVINFVCVERNWRRSLRGVERERERERERRGGASLKREFYTLNAKGFSSSERLLVSHPTIYIQRNSIDGINILAR